MSGYYTKTQTDNLLLGKANASHTHTTSDISGLTSFVESIVSSSGGDISVKATGYTMRLTTATKNTSSWTEFSSANLSSRDVPIVWVVVHDDIDGLLYILYSNTGDLNDLQLEYSQGITPSTTVKLSVSSDGKILTGQYKNTLSKDHTLNKTFKILCLYC